MAAVDDVCLPQSPFRPTLERLRGDPAWTVVELAATHDVLAAGPDLVVDLLAGVTAEVADVAADREG